MVKSVKNWMSGLKCLEDLESGCAPISILRSSKSKGRPENGSQSRRSDTSQALMEGTTGSGSHGSGDDWGQSGGDPDLPQISADNKNALTHRVIVSIGY